MIDIDTTALKRLDVLLTFLTTAAALVYGWLLLKFRSEFAAAKDLVSLKGRVDGLEARTGTIEGAVNHLPTREDTHALALSMSDMRGDVRSVAARLDGIEKIMAATSRKVEMIDEHLTATR